MKKFGSTKVQSNTTATEGKKKKMSKKKIASIATASFVLLVGIASCQESIDKTQETQQYALMSPSQEYTPEPTQEPTYEAPTLDYSTSLPDYSELNTYGDFDFDGYLNCYVKNSTGGTMTDKDVYMYCSETYLGEEYTMSSAEYDEYRAELDAQMEEYMKDFDAKVEEYTKEYGADMDGYIDCLNTNPEDVSDEAIQYCIDTYL